MNIYEQLIDTFAPMVQDTFTTYEIKKMVHEKHNTNRSSIIPSDYCYNRINFGIEFDKHLFVYLSRGKYQYVGENHPYEGIVYQRPSDDTVDSVAGEWKGGIYKSII